MTTQLPIVDGQIPRKGVVPDLGFDCHFWKCSEQTAATWSGTSREERGRDRMRRRLGTRDLEAREGRLGRKTRKEDLEDLDSHGTWTWDLAWRVGTDKDYLASSIAYRLDLHGTAEVVQTACSSALVAISRSDYALCGGVSFSPDAPIAAVDGLIWSPDGVAWPLSEQICSQLDYVEGHGTGTKLGDPLEVAALTEVLGSLASVSSFGVGGTNAHVVLKAAAQPLGSEENGHGPPEKVTWNRKPLEALLSSWTRTTRTAKRQGVQTPATVPVEAQKSLEDWFYEATREAVRLSELKPSLALRRLFGMPKTVLTTWQRAVPAAKAAGVFAPRLRSVRPPVAVENFQTYKRALVTGGLRGANAELLEKLSEQVRLGDVSKWEEAPRWGETGMVEDLGIEPLAGEHFVPVNDGLECFGRILDAEERAVPLAVLDVHWPVFRQQKNVFGPDDGLLATIEVDIPQPSRDQLKQVWTLGPAGSRHRGSRQSLEICQQHMVSGIPVLPGSALVALALEVSSQVLQTDTVQLQEMKPSPK
eukprot:Skav230450  [mRNA]  locus=scaffold2124:42501:54144:+ [translate_table: standard]